MRRCLVCCKSPETTRSRRSQLRNLASAEAAAARHRGTAATSTGSARRSSRSAHRRSPRTTTTMWWSYRSTPGRMSSTGPMLDCGRWTTFPSKRSLDSRLPWFCSPSSCQSLFLLSSVLITGRGSSRPKYLAAWFLPLSPSTPLTSRFLFPSVSLSLSLPFPSFSLPFFPRPPL